jgi:hypothetical protein
LRVKEEAKRDAKASSAYTIFLLVLLFDLQDGGNMYLQSVRLSPDYMVLQHRIIYTPIFAFSVNKNYIFTFKFLKDFCGGIPLYTIPKPLVDKGNMSSKWLKDYIHGSGFFVSIQTGRSQQDQRFIKGGSKNILNF